MSITLVQKSDLSKPMKNAKVALVLAGGAISGGAFKLGGLVALNRFLKSKKVTDFDIHVGLSAGAFLDAFIASGISPEELLRGLDGKSLRLTQFRPIDFYYPNFKEFGAKFYKLFRDLVTLYPSILLKISRYLLLHSKEMLLLVEDFVNTPSYANFERLLLPVVSHMLESTSLPRPARYIPSGLFDNVCIERYVRTNLERNHLSNNFKVLFRERGIALYICATNLNTARGVVFGHDSDHTLTISEAVQASTAIPAFYKPARIHGEDYVDGGVRKTANVSLAVHKGASLVIVYNPFRPFVNLHRYQLNPVYDSISDMGMGTVLNQALRTALHSRLQLGIDKLRLDPQFKGDVILLEPTETDTEFFSLNPLAFWNRVTAARHGYLSVKRTLEHNRGELERIFNAYGIEVGTDDLEGDLETIINETEETTPPQHTEKPEAYSIPQRVPFLRVVK